MSEVLAINLTPSLKLDEEAEAVEKKEILQIEKVIHNTAALNIILQPPSTLGAFTKTGPC